MKSSLTCLWWNVWLENFDERDRELDLLETLANLLSERSPKVVALQEVIASFVGEGAVGDLLTERGYSCRFDPAVDRGGGRFMGNLIASREPFDYSTYDCGSYGDRMVSLQVATLRAPECELAIGNTHWLMMRPVFELHRWRQMNRMLNVVDQLRRDGPPLVIGGDLNTAAHHPYILRLKQRFRLLCDDQPTWWYMGRSRLVKASLDHVFATDEVPSSLELLDRGPSDHAPLLAQIGGTAAAPHLAEHA
ncbi:MAG: endonuclease/exonuclease/phosphatase family protein [Solirubrobacterales bacterium]